MTSTMNSEKDGGAYTLHDQRGDAFADRYSVFRDGSVALLFNCVDGGITPVDLVRSLNAHDDLVAALVSTRRVAATHMKARGFSAEDIEQSFPQCDAVLSLAKGGK